MKTPKYVTQYIDKIKTGKIIVNKERQNLVEYLEKYILNRDDLYFDFQKIEDYVGFSEKWFLRFKIFKSL